MIKKNIATDSIYDFETDADKRNNQQELLDYSYIKVIAVAQTQQQRVAFRDTVLSMGMTLIDCIAPSDIEKSHHMNDADVWLVDSECDERLYNKLKPYTADRSKRLLMGFSKAPFLNETQLYAKWQRKLKRKFADMLDLPGLNASKIYSEDHLQWEYVVFLGASMGGPAAIKTFLDTLPADLPLTIIVAHHFNHNMIHTLPRILNRHNEWKCQVISTSQTLQAGCCFIVPVEQKVVFDSTGRVILTDEMWLGEYKPCIGDIFKNTSDVFGNELIGIIFSGMGSDGCQYMSEIADNDSHIWAQDPSSSACSSQPQATIDTGLCQFIGTPVELARNLKVTLKHKLQSE